MTATFDPFDPNHWVDAPGCEAFEIALGMRARSALPSSAVPVLEEHLRACDSCREFGERMSRVDAALSAYVVADATAPSWQRVHEKLARRRATYKRIMPAVMLAIFVVVIGGHWLIDTFLADKPVPPIKLVVAALVMLPVLGGFYALQLRRARKLLEQPDLIAAYRQGLQQGVRFYQQTRVVWVMLLAFFLYVWVESLRDLIDGGYHAGYFFARTTFVFAIQGVAIGLTLVGARKNARDLAELR